MGNWYRTRWMEKEGRPLVVGHGRLCAICRGGDHHDEHCDDAPEPSPASGTSAAHDRSDEVAKGRQEG
jgi:hypothetical protein